MIAEETPAAPAPAASRTGISLGLITVLGALARLLSVRYNAWPHGDVILDAAIAESLATTGRLLVPIIDVRYYPISQFGFGYPPDQHPPLWPLLGALLTPIHQDGYVALKIWSFLAGTALIPLSFLAFRPLLGTSAATWLSGLIALSYLLIDFSGNGSLWSALAALYLLFLWRLSVSSFLSLKNAALIGALMGLAFLVNYPSVVLVPALLGTAILQHGRRALTLPVLRALTVSAVTMLAICLPWLAINSGLHGNPLWSQPLERQLGGGDKQVDVQIVNGEVIKVNRPDPTASSTRLRTTIMNLYGNIGFLIRQMLVLAPLLNVMAAAALVTWAWLLARRRDEVSADSLQRLAPTVSLLLCHAALILLWPTTKFRYLVPLLPLALTLGTWLLWQLEPRRIRVVLAGVCTAGFAFMSVWTWSSVPTHTYYYDGGVVTDNFGQQGERIWADDSLRIARAASAIKSHGPGAILGDHLFYYLARQPLVIGPGAYSPEVVRHLVTQYDIRYAWLDRANAETFPSDLRGTALYEDDRFTLIEVR